MCGRAYSTYTAEELAFRYLNKRSPKLPWFPDLKPNYNLSPTQLAPVVLENDGERVLELMRWGLVPSWAKSVADASKYSLINARGEEIDQKRSYKGPFERRRCIVPLSGFYEWVREDVKNKRPFAIYRKDKGIMSVAGVWESWKSKDSEEEIRSFSLITIGANSFMEKIHDRMPVILDEENENAWLNPENKDSDALKSLLQPSSSELLGAHEVSKLVNSPKNNRPEVLEPVQTS